MDGRIKGFKCDEPEAAVLFGGTILDKECLRHVAITLEEANKSAFVHALFYALDEYFLRLRLVQAFHSCSVLLLVDNPHDILRHRQLDADRSTIEHLRALLLRLRQALLESAGVRKRDEAEATRTLGSSIAHHNAIANFAELFEMTTKRVVISIIRQAANIKLVHAFVAPTEAAATFTCTTTGAAAAKATAAVTSRCATRLSELGLQHFLVEHQFGGLFEHGFGVLCRLERDEAEATRVMSELVAHDSGNLNFAEAIEEKLEAVICCVGR